LSFTQVLGFSEHQLKHQPTTTIEESILLSFCFFDLMNCGMSLTSWVEVHSESHFSIYNLPFGVFSTSSLSPRCGSAIGNYVLDLSTLYESNLFNDIGLPENVFNQGKLNPFMELPRSLWVNTRNRIQQLLIEGENSDPRLKNDVELCQKVLIPSDQVSYLRRFLLTLFLFLIC
jgi:hypothetical protein